MSILVSWKRLSNDGGQREITLPRWTDQWLATAAAAVSSLSPVATLLLYTGPTCLGEQLMDAAAAAEAGDDTRHVCGRSVHRSVSLSRSSCLVRVTAQRYHVLLCTSWLVSQVFVITSVNLVISYDQGRIYRRVRSLNPLELMLYHWTLRMQLVRRFIQPHTRRLCYNSVIFAW